MIKRDYVIDHVSALLICWMVFYHILQVSGLYGPDGLSLDPLFFFMPWFFYKSGMYHRPSTLRDAVRKGASKFLYPFVVYTVIGQVFYLFRLYVTDDLTFRHAFLSPIGTILLSGTTSANAPLWFLLSLFLVKVIAVSITRRGIALAVMVASLSVGVVFNVVHFEITPPHYVINSMVGLSFYCAGYLFRQHQFSNSVFIVSVLVYGASLVFGQSIVDINSNVLLKGHYLLWPLEAIAAIVVINNMFSRYLYKELPVVSFVGRHSMSILCWHWIIIRTVDAALRYVCNVCDSIFLSLSMMLICIVFFSFQLNRKKCLE